MTTALTQLGSTRRSKPVSASLRLIGSSRPDAGGERKTARLRAARGHVGRNIILARGVLGVTQEELAHRAVVGRATIAQIEAGLADSRLGTVASIAAALGVHPLLLLARPDDLAHLRHFAEPTDRLAARIPREQIELIEKHRAAGLLKSIVLAGQLGARAVAQLGLDSPNARLGGALGSIVRPGLGTVAAALFASSLPPGWPEGC